MHVSSLSFSRPFAFLLAATGIWLAAVWFVQQGPAIDPAVVSVGVVLDLTVLVPLLYYLLLVRGRGWPGITVVPVFVVSTWAASALVPADQHALLGTLRTLAVPAAELILLGVIGVKAGRAVRVASNERASGADRYAAFQAAAHSVVPVPGAARAAAFELALLYYAGAGAWKKPLYGPETFTSHRRSGYGAIVGAVLLAGVGELVAGHVLLSLWSTTAAWVHAALSVYGLLWFWGDYQALRHRPTVLTATHLEVRLGLRWTVAAPLRQFARVERVPKTWQASDESVYLNAVPLGAAPTHVIHLTAPLDAEGLYGRRRSVTAVGLYVDEPERFEAALVAAQRRLA
ncbi:MAG: hypothetical protein AAGI71_00355 [Bacteroidota bacterium]